MGHRAFGGLPSVAAIVGSSNILYASLEGLCGAGVDLTNPAVGTDTSTAFQALIDAMAGKVWTLVVDGAIKCHDVKLRSGMTLQGLGGSFNGSGTAPTSGIIQSAGGTCALRNYNWRSPYNGGTPVSDYSLVVDQDITIRDLYINGNRGAGGANNANANSGDPRWNGSGQWISPVQIYGCRNLRIRNVAVYDPASFGIHVAYIDGGALRDNQVWDPTAVTNPTAGRNTDGLHVNGPARDLLIDGLLGATSDDFLALNADDGNVATSGGTGAFGSGIFGSYSNVYVGAITDVTASRLRFPYALNALRVLSNNSLVDRVTVSGVRGTVNQLFLSIGVFTGIPTGSGNIGTLTLDGFTLDAVKSAGATMAGGAAGPLAVINTNADALLVRDFTYHTVSNGGTGVDYWRMTGGTINYLEFRGHSIKETTTDGTTFFATTAGTVGNQRFIDCYRTRSNTGGIFYAAAGSGSGVNVFYLEFRGITLSGSQCIYLYASGTTATPSISSVGCTCISIAAAAYVFGTFTVSRFRASGSNITTLTSGNAPTSQKTDGTEG